MKCSYVDIRVEHLDRVTRTNALALANVLPLEQKLPVQVADVNGVQINDIEVFKSGENEIFQQLASNTTRTDHKDLGTSVNVLVRIGSHSARDRE